MAVAGPLLHAALGLALGLSLAGPPGPVNALIARESSRKGWAAGVRAGIPAPIVDTAYMTIVLLGAGTFLQRFAGRWLAVVGAVLMAYLAWQIARPPSGRSRELSGPLAVWGVTLSNPFQYAWWASAGTTFLGEQGAFGVAGFLVAIFGWVFAFSWLVGKGAGKASWADWFTPLLELASADLLFAFALQMAAAAAGL